MKKKIPIILSFFIVVASLVIGITYSFFESDKNIISNVGYEISFKWGEMFKSYIKGKEEEPANLNLKVDGLSMFFAGNDTVASEESETFVLELNADYPKAMQCDYDYVWVWDTESDDYEPLSDGKKEITISVQDSEEVNIPSTSIGSTIIASKSIVGSKRVKEENVTVRVYNLSDVDQSSRLENKKLAGRVTIGNVKCSYFEEKDLYGEIMYNSYQGIQTTSADNSEWAVVDENGYRYEGANPNNFICFAEECNDDNLYRIIGIVDGDIKLIKYDITNTNVSNRYFSMQLALPYGSDSPVLSPDVIILPLPVYEIRKKYAKLSPPSENAGAFNPDDWYFYERNGTDIELITSDEGYYHYLNVSDYGYSVLEKYCSRETLLTSYANTDCLNNNWLKYSKARAALTPNSKKDYYYINSDGNVAIGTTGTLNISEMNLVTFINTRLIVSGDGTYLSPYKAINYYDVFSGTDTLSIDGVIYSYAQKMTWSEWIDSIYNIDGYQILENGRIGDADGTRCIGKNYTSNNLVISRQYKLVECTDAGGTDCVSKSNPCGKIPDAQCDLNG